MNVNITPKDFLFYLIIIIFLIIAFSLTPARFGTQIDEAVYQSIINDWNEKGIDAIKEHNDNKPLPFLYIQKLMGNQDNARALNMMLILINTMLIYRLSKRYEAILFFMIPLFLNSMWLTVEMLETFFVLLSLNYKNYSGIFIGASVLIRPYSLMFTPLLKKEQWKYVIIIGVMFAVLLMHLGLFFQYGSRVAEYGTSPRDEVDYLAFIVWGMMLYIGYGNKETFRFGLVASIPLLIRSYGHYFITPYAMFFLGYLIQKQEVKQQCAENTLKNTNPQ